MPDHRRHRGPHPADAELFASAAHGLLRTAVHDLSWLLSRGYASTSALKLVGDRYGLRARQRSAVLRSSCSDAQQAGRHEREMGPEALRGRPLHVDGYNVLITLESALAGGILILGRDGCLRDLASLHGSFKRVDETVPALELLGTSLASWQVASCTIYLDQPVSNSGRLARLARELAAHRAWPWSVEVVPSPDAVLRRMPEGIVASADSHVLDHAAAWFNLAHRVVAEYVPQASWVDLASSEGAEDAPPYLGR